MHTVRGCQVLSHGLPERLSVGERVLGVEGLPSSANTAPGCDRRLPTGRERHQRQFRSCRHRGMGRMV
jgi:hypothetical protein